MVHQATYDPWKTVQWFYFTNIYIFFNQTKICEKTYWKTSGPKTAAKEFADQISSWCDATLAKNLHRNFNKL